MNFLIIEDDTNKIRGISSFLIEHYPNSSIDVKKAYQSGLKAIYTQSYDMVFLDMQLPTFDIQSGEDGYKFRKLAGMDILNELKRKKRQAKIIIVTQFETFGEGDSYIELSGLKFLLKQQFPENYIDTVYYNPSQSNWKSELINIFQKNL